MHHLASRHPRNADDLWSLAVRPGQVDERELWAALTAEPVGSGSDYRTRLLVHEALATLARRWGETSLRRRLKEHPQLLRLWREPFAETGFPSLARRIVQTTAPETILQMLRELGARLRRSATVSVGWSSSLLLSDLIVRRTEDVDLVDELPEAVRAEPALVDELAARYGLRLTHFASHYLPDGWEQRRGSLGRFGRLDVHVVDPLDVLAGKVFSRRTKDLDDLRAAWAAVDRQGLRQRLAESTSRQRQDEGLAEAAARNWYILTGEEHLP